ncbi:hypothetical protein NDU88_003200 [Pleurodeles waltl]|uniref:Uncharacterized protein n=1 Tax=Pleurodeles waltl TaxID=8319 RepID=A0AAV7W678_PLEWA|nr:hypothetical protein NDU88_003200 [Pleurodeles waltl]
MEESPGHGGKMEEQEGWRREFKSRKCQEERRTRNEAEERQKPSRRGPERPGSCSSRPGDGRTSIREVESIEERTGETRELFVPTGEWEDVIP